MFPALKTSFDLYLLALTPSQSPAVLRPHILYDQLRYFEYGSIYLDVALSFRASDKFWMALGILEIIEWWLLNVLPPAGATQTSVLDIRGFLSSTTINHNARLFMVSKYHLHCCWFSCSYSSPERPALIALLDLCNA